MSLRRKLIVYLVVAHVFFGGIAFSAFETKPALVAAEIGLAASLAVGVAICRGLFGPLDRIREGARLLSDSDFTSRFRPTGHRETDELVSVYNRMANHLREERTRNQEQNFFLEKILAASPLGLLTTDFDGRVTAVSGYAAGILQIDAATTIGRALEDVDLPSVRAMCSVPMGESRVIHVSGNRRIKCTRGSFLDRGFARGFIVLAELTEELRHSEKSAYEKLIRVMSHEVNNTVAASTSILHSCLAYHERSASEDRADYVEGLRSVIERTDRLNEFMRGVRRRRPHSESEGGPVRHSCDRRARRAALDRARASGQVSRSASKVPARQQ